MKVTGYQIREALRRWALKRDAAAALFDGSIRRFEDEQKASPIEVMGEFIAADLAIARIQVAQDRYNLAVVVTLPFRDAPTVLAEAVKLLGGAGRSEKMWRAHAAPKKERYSYGNDDKVRKDGEEHAKLALGVKAMLHEAEKSARVASALREAIAAGNAKEVEIQDLEAEDLA